MKLEIMRISREVPWSNKDLKHHPTSATDHFSVGLRQMETFLGLF